MLQVSIRESPCPPKQGRFYPLRIIWDIPRKILFGKLKSSLWTNGYPQGLGLNNNKTSKLDSLESQ